MRPLEGITVLDFTRLLPGAIASACLLNFGAKIIKIERPGAGDPARTLMGGTLFAQTNRGKRSVALDLKDRRGRELALCLASKCDVLMESFRPGVMERLGLSWEVVQAENPGLIFASLAGYERNSVMEGVAGHDINYIALAGLLDLLSPGGAANPVVPEIQLADVAGGSNQLVMGILLALQARHRTGLGQRVDVCMVSGMTDMLSVPLSAARSGTSLWPRREGVLSGHYGCYGLYRCKDSRWVAVGALDHHFWQNLCAELECEELVPLQFAPDPARTEVKRVLAQRFLRRTAEEWFALLGAKDCCVTPVRTFQEALANGCFKGETIGGGLSLGGAPKDPGNWRLPRVGQDSVEILSELGISSGRLQQLQREGVVG